MQIDADYSLLIESGATPIRHDPAIQLLNDRVVSAVNVAALGNKITAG
jgi:hypothetical protein